MKDKCEWKDGKLEPCEEQNYHLRIIENTIMPRARQTSGFNYCAFCGADIRKPEEKPLIVKSGETFASHENGINYLCTKPKYWEKMKKEFSNIGFIDGPDFFKIADYWKPFSEITLTDEIAKLRPIVVDGNSIEILLGIHDDFIFCYAEGEPYNAIFDGQYRLATAHELQELEK